MTRRHDRARFASVYSARTVYFLARSAFAATREVQPAPRHARHQTPRSAR